MDYIESKTELYARQNRLIEATLTLFKGVPGFSHTQKSKIISKLHNENNIMHGFYITPKAYKHCPQIVEPENLELIEKICGYNLLELNRGFYKSFGSVKHKSPKELLADQLLHYFSTYGLEALGLSNSNVVYIPNDVLELPADAKPVKITVIKYMSRDEIKQRTLKLIMSGMALSEDTLEQIIFIVQELKMKSMIKVDEIPNKEFRIRLCELLNLLPLNPIEFLRYMVFKKTGFTLLIKSDESIWSIKKSEAKVESHFNEYISNGGGLSKLAEVFHRYKPLWLAFKTESSNMASIINKIRKLADKYHKPTTPKILDTITSSKEIDIAELNRELEKVTIFKKISLVNSILFRCAVPESIAYFIRNGKVFADEYHGDFQLNERNY